jgi:hypothetical protein
MRATRFGRPNPPVGVADSRVEENPEGGDAFGTFPYARPDLAASADETGRVGRLAGTYQRHEGSGAGDGVRLRGRSKTLKGRTP